MLKTLSLQERQAVELYNEQIRAGDTEEVDIWADEFTLLMFLNCPDGPVVDIGCGLGRVIPHLENFGIDSYFGIDPSADRIEYCRSKFPEWNFETAEMRQMGSGNLKGFGGFILLSVLMHVPKEDLSKVLGCIRRSLLKGAPGLLNAYTPNAAKFVAEHATSLTLSFYETEEITKALEANGFILEKFRDDEFIFQYRVVAV